MSSTGHAGEHDAIDVTMMYVTHDAFRRDLARLSTAAAGHGTTARTAFRDGWATFKRFLTIHHTGEDVVLWPAMRAKLADRAEELALLDAMDAEHAAIDPLFEAIDDALDIAQQARLPELVKNLSNTLVHHLEHEETEALPLLQAVLTQEDWDAFSDDQRRRLGLKGAATYFPWLLDGAAEETRAKVLGQVPPPVRFLYRAVWRPRYARRTHAFAAGPTAA